MIVEGLVQLSMKFRSQIFVLRRSWGIFRLETSTKWGQGSCLSVPRWGRTGRPCKCCFGDQHLSMRRVSERCKEIRRRQAHECRGRHGTFFGTMFRLRDVYDIHISAFSVKLCWSHISSRSGCRTRLSGNRRRLLWCAVQHN